MRTIVLFVIVAYSLSSLLGVVFWLAGSQGVTAALPFASMFLPAVAVMIVRALTKEGARIDWTRCPLRYVPLALLLMPVTIHTIALPLLALAGPLPWQDWLTVQPDGLYHSPASRGWGDLTATGLAARVLLNAVVGVIIVSGLALFEEIGWRGWLLPRLTERMGARLAIVATSIISAFWHVPFGLSGIQRIDGMSPVALALGLPLGVIAIGLVIGWLWVRTESIWIVALAHGAFNNWGQYAFKYMREFTTPDPAAVLSAGFVGLYGVGILLLTFAMPAPTPVRWPARPSSSPS
jgi:membrane protease YdiL (CAAX protease family)